MNIVLINSEYRSATGLDHGGIATYTYAMANALAEDGHSVQVLCRPGAAVDPLAPSVRLHRFDFAAPSRVMRMLRVFIQGNIWWERGCSRSACRIVRQIHRIAPVHAVEIPEYNGLAAAFIPAFPVVIHLHTPSYLVDRYNHAPITRQRRQWHRFEASSIAKAQAIVSPSESLKMEVCESLRILPQRVAVIRHGIDTAAFDTISSSSPNPSVINILFAGRLERRKGADILAKVAPQILALDPRINLTIAGETMLGESLDYRRAIEAALDREERTRVWFLGPTPRARLTALYKQSDIFLFPSRYENAPYTILEAFAAKLPIVAANAPGVNELVRHGETGLLFDLGKPSSLIECLCNLAGNPHQRRALAEKGYDYVKREHSPQRLARQTAALYASLHQ